MRATHTTTGTHATTKNAQMSPKSQLCGFKWATNHNKCARDSMYMADLSQKPCLMRLHYISYQINLGTELIRSLRPL